jgi:exopolysaccharide production protein ExoZ
MIALAASGYARHSSYSAAEIATSLMFVPHASSLPPGDVLPIVQNGWTLNYEMFFYALFALWLAASRHLRLPGLVLTLGALVVLGRLVGPFTTPVATAFTSPLLLEFAAGALLAHVWLRGGLRFGLPLALILIGLGCYSIGATHPRLAILAGAALIVAGSLHPWIVGLENRLLLLLGNASYSLYLTHQFVIDAVTPWWPRLVPQASWAWSIAYMTFTLLLCTVVAWLCYRFLERPLISQLRKLASAPGAVTGQHRPA